MLPEASADTLSDQTNGKEHAFAPPGVEIG
jgi:hypothetical protein